MGWRGKWGFRDRRRAFGIEYWKEENGAVTNIYEWEKKKKKFKGDFRWK